MTTFEKTCLLDAERLIRAALRRMAEARLRDDAGAVLVEVHAIRDYCRVVEKGLG